MAENTKIENDEKTSTEQKEDETESSEEENMDQEEEEESDDDTEIVQANSYKYEAHVKLIGLLRTSGDLDKVREARENMSKIFPLTEELWLEWLKDELPLACLPEHRKTIVSLFERGGQDYQSVKLWIEFCQFRMDNMEGDDGISSVRDVFEKALTAAGLHVTEASADPPRLTEYRSYLEYEVKKGDPVRIQCLYERALKENCLVGDLWIEYTGYLDSKLKISSVVLPAYKRALRNCPWVSVLWQNYMRALERSKAEDTKIKGIVLYLG
ncbi:hypothetical protein QZH41_004454 [Actinostola sp. cb2023]|nr:hypothetical protein QZH41_004454 [Actinostola sp. cb2023]